VHALDGDRPIELLVMATIDGAHPARTHAVDDRVATCYEGAGLFGWRATT
jgi:hypothetical protein